MATYTAHFNEAVGNVGWFSAMNGSAAGNVVSWNADRLILSNGDGTFTFIWSATIGGNLNYNAATNTLTGTIGWMVRTSSSTGIGGVEYEQVGSGASRLNLNAGVFWGLGTNQERFNFVFAGADTLNAGSPTVFSSQILGGSDGADQFIGGGGTADTADYRFATGSLVVDLQTPANNTGEAEGDAYSSIENLWGSAHTDFLFGNSGSNDIRGGTGNAGDVLDGRDGNDTLMGGDGSDRLVAGQGDDTLWGGMDTGDLSGNDTIDFFGAQDPVFSAFGITVTLGSGGDGDVTFANTGREVFSGIESIWGTDLIDQITGNGGNNELSGRAGTDYLFGMNGNDTLLGGNGEDQLRGGAGDDQIDGENDLDTISFADASGAITFTLAEGGGGVANMTAVGLGTDTYTRIEGVEGTNFSDGLGGNSANNRLYGLGSDDFMDGNDGDDTLYGGAANDVLYVSAGLDVFFGGDGASDTGDDIMSFVNLFSSVSITLGAGGNGVASNFGIAGATVTYNGIDSLEGTTAGDALYGNELNNRLLNGGGSGADDLRGYGGEDYLDGGAGDDYLQGGVGADQIVGGTGLDVMSFYDLAAGVTVTLSASGSGSVMIGGFTDTYSSIEGLGGSDAGFIGGNDTIGADILVGNSAANRILGFWGKDTLSGMGGNDTIEGGGSDDTLNGNVGVDVLTGGDNNDALDGQGGRDLAVFVSQSDDTVRTHNANGSWTIDTSDDGTDTLVNVEVAQFADRRIVLEDPLTDFNADAFSELLWFQQSTGSALIRNLGNPGQSGGSANLTPLGASWTIQTTGDFNGDGFSDIAWKNTVTGEFHLRTMVNSAQSGFRNLGALGTNWDIAGSGDVNADGTGDLVLRNSTNGQVYLYMMQDNAVAGGASLGVIGNEWNVGAVGDFNGDGTSDVALRRSTDGLIYIWSLSNGAIVGGSNFGALGTNWNIAGAGDFNRDGTDDLLLRNATDGTVYIWNLAGSSTNPNGAMISGGANLGAIGSAWTVDAVADINGDYTSDILLKNTSTGQFYQWNMTNNVVTGGANLGTPGTDWQLI